MASDYRTVTAGAPTAAAARAGLLDRLRAVPAWLSLSLLVAVAFAVRVVTLAAHTTPRLFPDEYIYAALGRSLAHGSLRIRGEEAHFPAILEPVLAAPLWRLAGEDVELGYRLVQGLHALAVSLVAVPVYLLARRVGLSARLGLACAALTLLLPFGAFAPHITADAVGWPLALAALVAAVAALERPSARMQALFLGLAGLATLARVQYVVLPIAFIGAALLLEEGRVRQVVRAYRLTLALLALTVLAVVAAGTGRALGYYRDVLDLSLEPPQIARWGATDLMMLAYATGWVLVPAALVGLWLALDRPKDRAEHAFGAVTATLTLLLLFEAAVYAANGSGRFQERYLVALLPLVPLLFCLAARRAGLRPVRVATALVAGGLLLVASLVPLAEYTSLFNKQDSPLLQSVSQLERLIGVGSASLAVSLLAAALSALAAAVAWRPRPGVEIALAVAAAALATATVGAIAYDGETSARLNRTWVGDGEPTWVDAERLGRVAVLETPFSSRTLISHQLFWNSSIDRILKMKESEEVDAYGSTPVTIAADGRILAAGRAFDGPLLVQEYASWAELDGAVLVYRAQSSALWRPAGTPRLALLFAGRYLDGWLGIITRLTVWPHADGPRNVTVTMTLSLPKEARAVTLDVTGAGSKRVVTVAPGRSVELALPIDAARPVSFVFRPRTPLLVTGNRFVSVQATPPEIRESARRAA